MMHRYEIAQDFNLITRILHSTRYRNLLTFFSRIEKEIGQHPIKVVDIGCGPAKSFEVLNERFSIDYVGIELREDFCKLARERFGNNANFTVICDGIENLYERFSGADVVIGLEVFEHIPEPLVVRVLEQISKNGVSYFYCTVPNELGPAILIKNVGSFLMGYHRHKQYTWIETWHAFLCNLDSVSLHETRHIGFDWRWLAQSIRQNMKIERITTSPINFVPRSFSPSLGFVCVKR